MTSASPPPDLRGVFEVAIRVGDLARAERFYLDVLGLEVCVRDDSRRWVFLWAGARSGMVVLQEDRGRWPKQHFAFSAAPGTLASCAERLRARGVEVSGPLGHSSMPGNSLYFQDPDGNELEIYAAPAG